MIALIVLLNLTACETDAAAELPAPPVVTPVSMDSPADVCQQTRGTWLPGLRSCVCPQPLFHTPSTGCGSVALHERRVGELDVSIAASQDGPNALDAPAWSQILRGVPVVSANHAGPLFVAIGPWSPQEIDWEIGQVNQEPGPGALFKYDLPTLLFDTGQQAATLPACIASLKSVWPDSTDAIGKICGDVHRAVDGVRAPQAAEFVVFANKQVGGGDEAVDFSVANLPASMGHAIYRQVGKSGLIFGRSLQLNQQRHWVMHVLLSPTGYIMGGKVTRQRPLDWRSDTLIQAESIYFDRGFAPMSSHVEDLGNRHDLTLTLHEWSQWRQADVPPQRLPTDGQVEPLLQPLRAMVIEDAIDPRLPALWQRLQLQSSEVDRFVSTEELEAPLFAWPGDPVEAALQCSPENGNGGSHGTQVLSVLAHDLPGLRVAVMSAGGGDWASDVEAAPRRLIDKINRERPSVVNISKSYDDDIADCDAVFGHVFAQFRDSVLFVVAAGNSGMRNPATVCPASLAHIYQNAIAVGGANDDGSIGRSRQTGRPVSNFGREIVEVAAPACTTTAAFSDGKVVASQACGTSIAAPQVANAALRLVARWPWLSPARIKQLIVNACADSGLDVRCGGSLDFDALERWTPSSADEEGR